MNLTSRIKKYFLVALITISCVPTTTYTSLIGKTVTFLTGATFAPYVQRVLFAQKPNFDLRSIHQEAGQEVADNISFAWKNSKEWFALACKKLSETGKES